MNLITRAAAFAAKAHNGQLRKYSGEPYFNHVEAVARMVAQTDGDEEMIAAAYLHDVIEDCSVTYDQLLAEFGEDVATLVLELTKREYPGLNRKARKELEAKRLAKVSDRAKIIKRCDFAHNAPSIRAYDPEFWKVFEPEMRATLEAMA